MRSKDLELLCKLHSNACAMRAGCRAPLASRKMLASASVCVVLCEGLSSFADNAKLKAALDIFTKYIRDLQVNEIAHIEI